MSDATPPAGFGRPDLTAFARLDGLGLSVTGQRLEPDRAVLACRVVEPDQWCRRCGSEGAARDTVIRRLAHEPLGWRPTVLEVVVRRYRCADCGHVWRQDTSAAAEPRAKLSRTGLRWALEGIVVAHLTVARVAEGLGVAWDTANNAVLAEGKRLLINDPTRFEGVKVIGVDEHVWRHTRRGDKYVTVIIDLTPVRDGAGPARLLDMVEGRSKAAFKTWLADRDDAVPQVNNILRRHQALPQLVRHGDTDWDLHAIDDDAPLADRVMVETAMAMIDVIRADDMSRLSVCADAGCEGVVVDLSRNRSRRYCSTACGNRNAVAAYRARQAATAD